MSEEINNREYRQNILKELITQLHNGKTVEEVKEKFTAVFEGFIEETHQPSDPSKIPGHPANILKRENRAIEKLIAEIQDGIKSNRDRDVKAAFSRLTQIEFHYLKKENLFFPYMEQYGITAPPKGIWGWTMKSVRS